VFYQGNSDWAVRYYGVGDREGLDRWIADYSSSLASWPDRIPGLRSANPARRSAALAAAARSWIGSHPRAEARLLADKLGDWLRPWPDPLFHPRPAVAAFGALETALFAAAALGLFRCRRRGAAGFAIGVLALSTAAHVVLLAAWRYRTPYWEPVLILYGIASFFAAPKAARHSP